MLILRIASAWKLPAGAIVVALAMACDRGGPAPDVVSFTGGDYEALAFSPTGRYLALAERDTSGDQVLSQVVLYDFDRRRLDTLISRGAAAGYAVYSATVYELKWVSDSTFVASYSDGDVEGTDVLLLANGRVLSEHPVGSGPTERPPGLVDSLARLYPDVAPTGAAAADVFNAALGWRYIRGPDFVVLQKNYSGTDNNIWLFRVQERYAEVIHQVPPDTSWEYGLVGGFMHGNELIIASGGHTVTLYRWREGQLTPLKSFPTFWQHARLLIRGTDPQQTWLVMQLATNTDRPSGHLFVYQDGKLSRFMPGLDTADMDTHLGRGLIALSAWSGSERHVRVRRL